MGFVNSGLGVIAPANRETIQLAWKYLHVASSVLQL